MLTTKHYRSKFQSFITSSMLQNFLSHVVGNSHLVTFYLLVGIEYTLEQKVSLWKVRMWNLMKVKAERHSSSNEQESMYMTGKNEFMYSLPS